MSQQSVKFEIPEINHGLKKGEGLLKLRESGLELEFEVEDSFVGMVKSGIKTVQLSYGDLESIQFDRGWFSSKIVLEATSMKVFDEIPGTEAGTCTLKINRKKKEEAEQLVSTARMRHSEYKLKQMEGE